MCSCIRLGINTAQSYLYKSVVLSRSLSALTEARDPCVASFASSAIALDANVALPCVSDVGDDSKSSDEESSRKRSRRVIMLPEASLDCLLKTVWTAYQDSCCDPLDSANRLVAIEFAPSALAASTVTAPVDPAPEDPVDSVVDLVTPSPSDGDVDTAVTVATAPCDSAAECGGGGGDTTCPANSGDPTPAATAPAEESKAARPRRNMSRKVHAESAEVVVKIEKRSASGLTTGSDSRYVENSRLFDRLFVASVSLRGLLQG